MGVISLGCHTRPACHQVSRGSLKLCQECEFNSCVCVFFIPMGSREFYDHIWALWRHISHMGQMRDADWSRETLLRSDWLGPKVAPITTLLLWISSSFPNARTTRITQRIVFFSHINLQVEQYSIEKECCPVYPPKRKALWHAWKERIHIIITDWNYSFGFG